MGFNNRIIENARVLTADYLPNKMVHRDGERQQIASNLKPMLQGEPPIDMLLYGPPGTGKTAMADFVVQKLEEHSPGINTGRIDCFRQPSRFEVYYKLVTDMGEFYTRDGTSTEELVDELETKARKAPMVIIIDEVDQIKNEKVLHHFSRFNKVGIIMIANREDVFANMDQRIRSSFSARDEIRFKAYSSSELVDILKDRAEYGLRDGVVERSTLKKIAEKSKGDARVAIGALRIAAQKAENRDIEKITEDVVMEGFSDAVEETESISFSKLNRHQRVMYNVIKKQGEVRPGSLYEKYREEVEDDRNERTLRRYLNKMVDYGLIEAEGEKKGRFYSPAK